ncbi:hypothetical protein J6590_034959 [Homalodisca vitripennis]|nr:hypothetical protein J6590_034959 [Homalodisca vitripennis]
MIDSPDLLRSFSFLVNVGTRSRNLFAASHYSNNYSYYGPIARLHRYGNSIPPDIDLLTRVLRLETSECYAQWTVRNRGVRVEITSIELEHLSSSVQRLLTR